MLSGPKVGKDNYLHIFLLYCSLVPSPNTGWAKGWKGEQVKWCKG